MNRKLILLNLVLLALAAWLGYSLRMHWLEAKAHERAVLEMNVLAKKGFAPPPAPPWKPVAAAEYIDVAQKMLFAKDRNPNVIIDAPAPPPPPPPMPPLPAYHGIIAIGKDPEIFLSVGREGQKRFHAGEKVGPFKLISFNQEKVVFEWDGKPVERKPEELKEKESPPEQAQAAPAPQASAPAVSGVNSGSLSASASSASNNPASPLSGKQSGEVKTCVTGDKSPPGTVIEGYKKVVSRTMFGETCFWEPVK